MADRDHKARALIISRFNPMMVDSGGAMRVAQNANALSKHFNVDILVISNKESTGDYYRGGKIYSTDRHYWHKRSHLAHKLGRKLWHLNADRYPEFDGYIFPEAVQRVKNLHKENGYKFAVIEEITLSGYAKVLKQIELPYIYDAHNLESVLRYDIDESQYKKRSVLQNIRKSRFINIEKRLYENSAVTWTCSKSDKLGFEKTFSVHPNVSVVPNSINLEQYERYTNDGEDWSRIPIKLVYLGTYVYYPNEQAALTLINQVFPLVAKDYPNAQLSLIGREPTTKMIESAQGNDNIQITGRIESVHEYLQEPSIFVLPIQLGGGTRLKILEAFAARKPVICSPKACEGINCSDKVELCLAETPHQFAQLATEIWNNSTKRTSMCENAFKKVASDYSWSAIETRIMDSVQPILTKGPHSQKTTILQ